MDLKDITIMSWGCATIGGHADRLAKQLDCPFQQLPSMVLPETRNILFVGAFPGDLQKIDSLRPLNNYEIYVLFVGSDVLDLQKAVENKNENCIRALKGCHILCVADHLKVELEELGIEVEKVITLVPQDIPDVQFENNRKGILVYMPSDLPFKRNLFRFNEVKRLAESLPEYDFHVYGGSNNEAPYENWYTYETLTPKEEIKLLSKIILNLRVTRHDGMPQTLIRLAQVGIQSIVSSFESLYMIKVPNDEKVLEETYKVIKEYGSDDLTGIKKRKELEDMRKYYIDKFSTKAMIKKFQEL